MPVDHCLLVQKDGGGGSDQAITRMFFPNAQLLDSLAAEERDFSSGHKGRAQMGDSPNFRGRLGGDFRLARDIGLAEPAAISLQTKMRTRIIDRLTQVLLAGHLVMARLGEGTCRAPGHAFAAGPPGEEETIGMVVFIGARGGRDLDSGDHRTAAHRFALRGDQAVAKTKGPQAGGIGRMPL